MNRKQRRAQRAKIQKVRKAAKKFAATFPGAADRGPDLMAAALDPRDWCGQTIIVRPGRPIEVRRNPAPAHAPTPD